MGKDREDEMLKLSGTSAAKGVAVGQAQLLCHDDLTISEDTIEKAEVDNHIFLFEKAVSKLDDDLALTRRLSRLDSFPESEDIIETQQIILHDPELNDQVRNLIKGHHTAERAIWEAFQIYIDLLEQTRNETMFQRLTDIREVRDRLIRILLRQNEDFQFQKGAILVADEITPSEVIHAVRNKVKGLVCNTGGLTSHSAILAHAMELPMLIGVKKATTQIAKGDWIALNADSGEVIFRPEESVLKEYAEFEQEIARKKEELMSVIDEPNELKCGHRISLQANIEFQEELPGYATYKPQGVGLLRTESLILSTENALDVDCQIDFYRTILSSTGDDEITIRLFDIGGDKLNAYEKKEANPFLGWRGVRVLLDKKDLLRDQLRALLTVSGEYPGRIRILVPMISWVEEMIEIREEVELMKQILKKEKTVVDEYIQVGAMVEVPSMVVQADKFANYSDFFSVGTNDLTQYTLAVDRGNTLISHLYQQIHPAVFRAVAYAVRAANSRQMSISVCGEAASNPMAAMAFVGLGIHNLSMTPNEIPTVKSKLRSVTYQECKSFASQLLNASTMNDVREIIARFE
jgi:phosphotransferase system enzyme I (PtsI)